MAHRDRVQKRTTDWWNARAGAVLHEQIVQRFKSAKAFAETDAKVDAKTLYHWIRAKTVPQPALLRNVCRRLKLDPAVLREAALGGVLPPVPSSMETQIDDLLRGFGYALADARLLTAEIEVVDCVGNGRLGGPRLLAGYVNSGELTTAHLRAFTEALRKTGGATGMLACHSRISGTARELAATAAFGVSLTTLAELEAALGDLHPLVRSYVGAYEASEASTYYVTLSAYRPIYDVQGRLRNHDFHESIEAYVASWLRDESRNQLSILGDFGSGKTWLAQRLTYIHAREHLKQEAVGRIPLYIPLGGFAADGSIHELVMQQLALGGVHLASGFTSFDALNRAGRLLLILDGFDQMGRRVDAKTMRRHFTEIEKLVVPHSKVILTCRTAYFKTDLEHISLFAPESNNEIIDAGTERLELRAKANFETVYLAPFGIDDIQQALLYRLGRTRWQAIYERIRKTYDLANLARRPMLLSMIVEVLPHLARRGRITPAILYDVYVRQWLKKTTDAAILPPQMRLSFMKAVAVALYEGTDTTIPVEQFPRHVREHFQVNARTDVDQFAHDVRTHALLIRDDAGNYFFAHRSFMEFFVALKCVKEVRDQEPAIFDQTRLTPEVAGFVRDLLTASDTRTLWKILKNSTIESSCRWSGGNAATLLNMRNANFCDRKLRRRRLRGAYLAQAALDGCDLSYSDLSMSNLNYASLRNCNLRSANLTDISIEERGGVRAVAFTPRAVVAGFWNGKITAYALRSQERATEIADQGEAIRTFAIDPTRSLLAVIDYAGRVTFWPISTSEKEFSGIRQPVANARSIAWSHDGDLVAVGLSDGDISIWSFRNQAELRRLRGHRAAVWSAAFHPTRPCLASGGYDGTIRTWSLEDGSLVFAVDAGTNEVRAVCYDSGGTTLVGAGSDGVIRTWSVPTGDFMGEIRGHRGAVKSLECHPREPLCVSASYDTTARLWNLPARREVSVLSGHTDYLSSATFSPSGKEIATTGLDATIRIWSVATGTQKRLIRTSRKSRLTCAGLVLTDAVGLSDAQLAYLLSRGAIR
jgi:WD40 repeat protein